MLGGYFKLQLRLFSCKKCLSTKAFLHFLHRPCIVAYFVSTRHFEWGEYQNTLSFSEHFPLLVCLAIWFFRNFAHIFSLKKLKLVTKFWSRWSSFLGQILDIAVYKYTKRGNGLSYEVYFGTHPIVEVNRKVICYYTLPPNYYCLIHRTSVFGFPQWLLPTLLPQTTSNCKRVLLVSVTSSRQSCNLTKGFYNYFLHKMFCLSGRGGFE